MKEKACRKDRQDLGQSSGFHDLERFLTMLTAPLDNDPKASFSNSRLRRCAGGSEIA